MLLLRTGVELGQWVTMGVSLEEVSVGSAPGADASPAFPRRHLCPECLVGQATPGMQAGGTGDWLWLWQP